MAGSGTLEVILVGATNLKDTELFGNADPYAIVTCGSQQARTGTAADQGSHPVWNHRLGFTLGDPVPTSLTIKILNDNVFKDDEIGTCCVPLGRVFSEGRVAETSYPVFRSSGRQQGEIKIILAYRSSMENTKLASDSTAGVHQPESHRNKAAIPYPPPPPVCNQAPVGYPPPPPVCNQAPVGYPPPPPFPYPPPPPFPYPPPQQHDTSQVHPPQYPPAGVGECATVAPAKVKHDKHKLKKEHKHKHQKYKHGKLKQHK